MKRILKLSILPLLFLSAIACSDDDNKTVVADVTAPVLISPQDGSSVVLDPDLQDNPGLTLVWNHGAYDVATPINYNIEIAASGTDFDSIVSPGLTTTNRVYAFTVAELNGIATRAGLTPFESGKLDVRVVASLGDNQNLAMTSNVITINVTPYTTESPKLYLRGNFTGASGYGPDWGDNTTPPFLEAAAYGETAFEGYIYMNVAAPEFKFIPTNVGFTGDYGDADATGASGVLVQEGETNIKPGGAGYYLIQADTEELTYSVTPTSWGVIGSSTAATTGGDGWGSDADMTYDATSKTWKITMPLAAGELKFRANNAWAINYGDAGRDGTLDFNDSTNINVPTAGNYVITLDLSHPRAYTYTLTAQ